ncbi:MAG: hypothetical protein ACOY3P_19490 [Planctomycetota bacterium]
MLIPRKLAPISKFCDPDSTRFATGGVRLERDGDGKATAVVTDCRRLIAVEWDEMDGTEYPNGFHTDRVPGFAAIIPEKGWNEAMKLPQKNPVKPILKNLVVEEPTANGKVTLGATDLENDRRIAVTQIDGRYPRWQDCIPKREPHEEVRFNVDAKQFAETISVAGDLAEDISGAPRVVTLAVPLDPTQPLCIHVAVGDCRATAVTMPFSPDEEPRVVRERAAAAIQAALSLFDNPDSAAHAFQSAAMDILSPNLVTAIAERVTAEHMLHKAL